MAVLDQIKKKDLIESTETVNTDWQSPSVSLDDRTDAFSIFFKYDSGSTVDMKVYLQLSNDNENFGNIEESLVTITDNTGSILFDLDGSGAQYARISIEVTSGSIDVTRIRYTGSQFH